MVILYIEVIACEFFRVKLYINIAICNSQSILNNYWVRFL